MPLNPMQQNTITRAMQQCKYLVEQALPVLNELDTVYNSVGGMKTTVVQADLDAVPSFSGLTKQQLDDGLFALTSTLKTDLNTALAQMTQLAVRSS